MKRGTFWYIGLALFVALIGAIAYLFYFRGYVSVLAGDSSSFLIELARVQARVHPDADVVVVGNSTAAEGFLANYFNAHAAGHVALNLGIPSGNVFLFDRMVAMAEQEGVRPKQIVVMLTPDVVNARPGFNSLRNDLTLLKTILSTRDLATLGAFSRNFREYAELAGPVLARPILFHGELHDFFSHPAERLDNAKAVREWLAGFHRDSPMPESNRAFAVCDAGALDQLPATIERLRQTHSPMLADVERVGAGYAVLNHMPLAVDPFLVARLRRSLERLAATGARVYVAEAPYYDPGFSQYSAEYRRDFVSSVHTVTQGIPGVVLLPTFQADCSMMADTLHLNRKGGELFTEYLRTRVL